MLQGTKDYNRRLHERRKKDKKNKNIEDYMNTEPKIRRTRTEDYMNTESKIRRTRTEDYMYTEPNSDLSLT